MGLREVLVPQFRRPEGPLGRVAGLIMAARPSNRRRNYWTVELLCVGPEDRVLEIGCGPGVALAASAERTRGSVIVGLDHSPEMLDQAARRNRRAIERGRVRLQLGDLERLPMLGGPFDKIFSVNVIQFLPDKDAAFRALHDVTAPGGIVATTYQPRHRNPNRADAIKVAEEVEAHMAAAGFVAIKVEELSLRPVSAVCVLGRKGRALAFRT